MKRSAHSSSLLRGIAFVGVLLSLLLSACALQPPVQEMSDARQAIQAAREAKAEEYATERLQMAEESLEEAARYLDAGYYLEARNSALFAKEEAVRARDKALATEQKP